MHNHDHSCLSNQSPKRHYGVSSWLSLPFHSQKVQNECHVWVIPYLIGDASSCSTISLFINIALWSFEYLPHYTIPTLNHSLFWFSWSHLFLWVGPSPLLFSSPLFFPYFPSLSTVHSPCARVPLLPLILKIVPLFPVNALNFSECS